MCEPCHPKTIRHRWIFCFCFPEIKEEVEASCNGGDVMRLHPLTLGCSLMCKHNYDTVTSDEHQHIVLQDSFPAKYPQTNFPHLNSEMYVCKCTVVHFLKILRRH